MLPPQAAAACLMGYHVGSPSSPRGREQAYGSIGPGSNVPYVTARRRLLRRELGWRPVSRGTARTARVASPGPQTLVFYGPAAAPMVPVAGEDGEPETAYSKVVELVTVMVKVPL